MRRLKARHHPHCEGVLQEKCSSKVPVLHHHSPCALPLVPDYQLGRILQLYQAPFGDQKHAILISPMAAFDYTLVCRRYS